MPEFVADEPQGDWYIMSREGGRLYSRPFGTLASYSVRELPVNAAVLVLDFEDGSARVAMMKGSVSIPGILEVDDRVEVDGDTAKILGPTELRTPSMMGWKDDGRPNPLRAYQTMFECEGGETLRITDRFEASGRRWVLVEPPKEASLFVRGSEIRPASAEEIAAILAPPALSLIHISEPTRPY